MKNKKKLTIEQIKRKWRIIVTLQRIAMVVVVVGVMTAGAAGIYTFNKKHKERLAVIESSINELFETKNIILDTSAISDTSAKEPETTVVVADVPETTSLVVANAGGSMDDDTLTEQDKGYQEYIKEQESTTVKEKMTEKVTEKITERVTSSVETTVAKEPETTPAPTTVAKEPETTPAPTTVAKEPETTPASTTATATTKKGKVVTDEKTRQALIQMGFDPDNYVASELTTAEKLKLIKLVSGEVATENPDRVIHESVDWENYKSEYDNSDLPKPMG